MTTRNCFFFFFKLFWGDVVIKDSFQIETVQKFKVN